MFHWLVPTLWCWSELPTIKASWTDWMHAMLMFLRKQYLCGSCCCSLIEKKQTHFVLYHLLFNISVTFIQGSVKTKMIILPLWTPVSIIVILFQITTVISTYLTSAMMTCSSKVHHMVEPGHITVIHWFSASFSITKWDYSCSFLHLSQPFSMLRKTGSSDIICHINPWF